MYARPSIGERIYLLWTFRNFRRLPQQVLNARQRQLIEKLVQTSSLRRQGAAVGFPIIGVVENVQVMPERKAEAAAKAGKLVEISTSAAEIPMRRAVGSERISIPPAPEARSRSATATFDLRTMDAKPAARHSAERKNLRKANRAPLQLGVIGAWGRSNYRLTSLAAMGAALLAGLLYFGSVRSTARPSALELDQTHALWTLPAAKLPTEQSAPTAISQRLPKPSAARPGAQVQDPATPIRAAAAMATSSPGTAAVEEVSSNLPHLSPTPGARVGYSPIEAEKSATSFASAKTGQMWGTTAIASREDESTPVNAGIAREVEAASTKPLPPERVVIAAAPQSFSYPVAPNPTLTGKVNLRVVIGAEGSVRDVIVLSGKRALADAAVRAVRRWRYRPPELNGYAAEAETNVTINFVGDDAVTIAYR
jgi:protein TonB